MKLRLTKRARLELADILRRSRSEFGDVAQRRYERLLNAAMRDLEVDAQRPGVRTTEAVQLYHTRHASRRLPAADRVGRPRHIIVYRVVGDEVRVLRFLHDAMDLPERLRDL